MELDASTVSDPDDDDTDAWIDEIKAVLAKRGRVFEVILTSTNKSRMISFNRDVCSGPQAGLIRLGIAAYINGQVRE